ncbi:MAG: hypothetical protein LBL36_03550 [Clostridiales Family XIII bacterium]|jgi:hypothetical protein|nr:hypothetical protein [Clostridiales Family XIII bacterium]
MEFIASHWHCIVPAIGIAVALLFMRDKNKKKNDNAPEDATRRDPGEDYE